MRLKVGRLGRPVEWDLPNRIWSWTAYFLRRAGVAPLSSSSGSKQRLRRSFREHQLGGDYGCAYLVLLVIALLVVGALRLLRSLRTPARHSTVAS